MFSLSPRLMTAASMINPCRKTVDVGTDHAFLPAFLVLNSKTDKVLACDIGIQPLENARKTVTQYSLQEKIELRVSDGLKSVSPAEAQEISICGMGGNLMVQILSDVPWIKSEDIHLVLQPMTHSEDVRRFLCENGFVIDREECVADNGRLYCCISSYWKNMQASYEEGYYYFGELLLQKGLAREFVQKQYDRIKKRRDALLKSGRDIEEAQKLSEVTDYYERKQNSLH